MADSPLDSGPVVGTDIKENLAAGYQRLGNVTQNPVDAGVTGDMVLKAGEARAQAITGLASGIEQGFQPLIDQMITGYKQQQATTDQTTGYAAGTTAGAGIGNAPPAGAAPTGSPAQAPTGGEQAGTPAAPIGGGSVITRGASGALSILPNFGLFGTGGNSGSTTYAKSFGQGAIATAGMATDTDINQLRVKYDGDPEAFKGAADAYINGRNWSILGPAAGPARVNAMQTANQNYNNLVLKKGASDLVDSQNAISTQINNVSNDMSALARAGQMNSPMFDAKQDALQDLYGALKENPAYGLSPAAVDDQLTKKLNGFIGDHISGQVDSAYQQGGASAALKSLGDNIDKVPDLSDADRAQILAQGEARLRYNEGINRDSIDANRKDVAAAAAMANAGQPVDPAVWDRALATARQTGDTESITTITAERAVHPANPITNGTTPAQNQTPPTSGVPAPYASTVRQIESRNGAASTNLYQFQPGTWAKYGAKYGDISNPQAQERAFADLTADNRAQLTTALGRAPTDGELYLAHQQGAAGAVALIKNPGTPAGQLVAPENISRNGGDPNAPASTFVQKWGSRFASAPSVGPALTGAMPPTLTADLSGLSTYAHKGEPMQVSGFIVHHTGGGGTPQDVIQTLNQRGLGVQYVMDRDGKIYSALPEGTRGAHMAGDNGVAKNGSGLSNANALGMEIIAKDANDVTPQQKQAAAAFIAGKAAQYGFPISHVFGHGEVQSNKEPDEGLAVAQMVQSGAVAPANTGSAPSSVVSANGTPFTNDQLKNSPGLYSSYVSAVAGDANTRQKAMDALGGSIETSISNFSLPTPQTLAMYQQLAEGNPGEQARMARIEGGATALLERQGGGGGIGEALRAWHGARRRRCPLSGLYGPGCRAPSGFRLVQSSCRLRA